MSGRGCQITTVGKAVFHAVLAERITFLAAAIAYYAFISMVPLLVLVISLASIFGEEFIASVVIETVDAFLTPTAQELLHEALVGGVGRAGATTLSLIIFAWSGLKVFRGLDIAFSHVFGTTEDESVIDHAVNVLTVLLAIGLGILVIVLVGTIEIIIPNLFPIRRLVSVSSIFIALIVLLFPMFYVFPSRDMTVREALPGTIMVALGWTILASLFGVYASLAGTYMIYGILGGVLFLITLFYIGAIILLVGAVFNAVLMGEAVTLEDPIESIILE